MLPPRSLRQVAELDAEVASLTSERELLEREADQMSRNMEEVARQLQVRQARRTAVVAVVAMNGCWGVLSSCLWRQVRAPAWPGRRVTP